MVLSIELTKEDFYQFSYYTNWTAPWNKKKRFFYYVKNILYSGIVGIGIAYLLMRRMPLDSFFVGFAIVLLFYVFIAPGWIRNNYRKRVDQFYDNPSNSSFFSRTELTLDEIGVQNKDETSTTRYSWQAFVRKVETEDYFYLYLNTQQAVVVLKRVFSSEREKIEFEKILLAYFPLLSDLQGLKKEAI